MKNTSHIKGFELASFILGNDFISPKEISKAYGLRYTNNQIKHLNATLPNTQVMFWLRINKYILIAGPPTETELNLFQIRDLDDNLFYKNHYNRRPRWWTSQKFGHEDKVAGGKWLAIRKNEVPYSFLKTWKEQKNLITRFERVPNITEASYAITAYAKVRGIYLLNVNPNNCFRTASIDADGRHVTIKQEGGMLSIRSIEDNRRYDTVAILSSVIIHSLP